MPSDSSIDGLPAHADITALCKAGDELAQAGNPEAAKQKYLEALRLLPGDHQQWAAATWIYVAIGDVHFQLKNFDKAFKCFSNAVQCPTGLGNPYVHLRLGQINYELGDLEKSADELTRAYMAEGLGTVCKTPYVARESAPSGVSVS